MKVFDWGAAEGEDSLELADMMEADDVEEGHFLEVPGGHADRGREKALGSMMVAFGRPGKPDDDNCASAVLRSATYAALEAVRMPQICHACNVGRLLPPCSAGSRYAWEHTYRIVDLKMGGQSMA